MIRRLLKTEKVCSDKIFMKYFFGNCTSWLGIFIHDERLDIAKLNTMLTEKLLSIVPYKIFTMLKNIWHRICRL
jgi:hypothetical protein